MKALPMSIPPRTRAELASPAPRGHRHEQMKKLVLPLLAAGLTPDAVFVQLRGTYEPDVSDREIHDLIQWAVSKNPRPFGCGDPAHRRYRSDRSCCRAGHAAAFGDRDEVPQVVELHTQRL